MCVLSVCIHTKKPSPCAGDDGALVLVVPGDEVVLDSFVPDQDVVVLGAASGPAPAGVGEFVCGDDRTGAERALELPISGILGNSFDKPLQTRKKSRPIRTGAMHDYSFI